MMRLTRQFLCAILTLASVASHVSIAQAQETRSGKNIEEVRRVASLVSQDIRALLNRELQLSGPLRALLVCKYACPEVLSSHSRRNGWRVAFVSLKPRNAALGMADSWEQKVIADFSRRVALGEKADSLEFVEIVSEPHNKYFRYAKTMVTEQMCLLCHGAHDKLPDAVKAQLAIDYPFDRAIDFNLGQVYGIVSIKRSE